MKSAAECSSKCDAEGECRMWLFANDQAPFNQYVCTLARDAQYDNPKSCTDPCTATYGYKPVNGNCPTGNMLNGPGHTPATCIPGSRANAKGKGKGKGRKLGKSRSSRRRGRAGSYGKASHGKVGGHRHGKAGSHGHGHSLRSARAEN